MHKKGFTPLDKNRRLRRNYLTGFTPLETIGRRQKAMVSLTGFTLIEILVSALILALVMTGLANIFLAKCVKIFFDYPKGRPYQIDNSYHP